MIMDTCPDLLEWEEMGPGGSANCPGAWPTREGVNMPDPTCSVEGCAKPIYVKRTGMCTMHDTRMRRHGSTENPEYLYVPRPKKPKAPCVIDGCERPVASWGWCEFHYRRWKRTGDPIVLLPISIDQIPDPAMLCGSTEDIEVITRFWSKVDVGDCWEWTAGKTTAGYGEFCKNNKGIYAHRQSYEWLVGPIPEGLVIDHVCRNPPCLNPDHLRVVTRAVNNAVGYSPVAIRARAKDAIS